MDNNIYVEIYIEVLSARRKFPVPNTTFAALVEEVGEVATALMDLQNGKIGHDHLVAECVQVAAMAVRVALDGDPGFPASMPPTGMEPPGPAVNHVVTNDDGDLV